MFVLKNDLFFSYKSVIRYLLINKYGFFINTNQLPFLKKIVIFFNIYNLIDLEDSRSFNYAYFFRFFFGKRSFFTKSINIFHLGVNFFSFSVQCFFYKSFSFFPLHFFLNDVLAVTDKQFFKFNFYLGSISFFLFSFYDMSIFIEKKTNIGFYNLKDPIYYKLFFTGTDVIASFLLVKCLKI